MPQLFRRRKKRTLQKHDDPYAITTAHARALAGLNERPTLYNQRIAEQLSFVGTGGQRWVRTLQVRLPDSDDMQRRRWWVVPLGQFQLRRFADVAVTDSSGARVNLLTRRQHGIALAKATLNKHLFELPAPYRQRLEKSDAAGVAYRRLRALLHRYFTVMGTTERTQIHNSMVSLYVSLLTTANLDPREVAPWTKSFEADFEETNKLTQYLCWLNTEAGEVINLQVSYTATDPEHNLTHKTFCETSKSLINALTMSRDDDHRNARRRAWSNWYRQLGLAPFNYKFKIPTHLHTSSYYFAIEAPAKSYVTYLDWEISNSVDNDEVDCAYPSAHVHNEKVATNPGLPEADHDGIMRAYLRCIPHHHKQILGTALLNITLVWLLTTKDFAGNVASPLAGILIVAPSVLIAYLVRQQRHYYAHVMRRQRAILWGYLAASLFFLIAVAFSTSGETLKATDSLVPAAWVLAISSAAVFGWYLPLGYGFDRAVWFLAERKWEMVKPSDREGCRSQAVRCFRSTLWWNKARYKKVEEKWQCYQEAVAQYCRWTLVFAAVLAVAMTMSMMLGWNIPTREKSDRGSARWANGVADSGHARSGQALAYPTRLPAPR